MPIINHDGHKKSLRVKTEAVDFVSGSLNGTRTRVLALRGLRPRPLVDEAIDLLWEEYYHEKFFSAILRLFSCLI